METKLKKVRHTQIVSVVAVCRAELWLVKYFYNEVINFVLIWHHFIFTSCISHIEAHRHYFW